MDARWQKVEDFPKNMGFISEFNHTVDPKGRMIIPVKYRSVLGNTFVITKGIDKCLYFYPQEEWAKMEKKLEAIPLSSAKGRKFVRFLSGGATEVDMDAQGRILLPAYLREFASIKKDVVMTGTVGHIELWAKEKFDEITDEMSSEDVAEGMEEYGI